MENTKRINGIPSYGIPSNLELNKGKDGKNIIFGFGIYDDKSEDPYVINVEVNGKYTYVTNKSNPKENDTIYVVSGGNISAYPLLKISDSNYKTGEKLYEFSISHQKMKNELDYTIEYDEIKNAIKLIISDFKPEMNQSILFFELYTMSPHLNKKKYTLMPDSSKNNHYTCLIERGDKVDRDVSVFLLYKENSGVIRKIYDDTKTIKGVSN